MTVLVAATPFRPLFFRPCSFPLPSPPTLSRIILSFYPVSFSLFPSSFPFLYVYICVYEGKVCWKENFGITLRKLCGYPKSWKFPSIYGRIKFLWFTYLRWEKLINSLGTIIFIVNIDFRIAYYISQTLHFNSTWRYYFLLRNLERWKEKVISQSLIKTITWIDNIF